MEPLCTRLEGSAKEGTEQLTYRTTVVGEGLRCLVVKDLVAGHTALLNTKEHASPIAAVT